MSFFNFFRNESLFDKGYNDAQEFYEYYQTLDAVKNHIIAFDMLNKAKPQSEKNGWYAFVWEMEQPWQIPKHTEPSKAIPLLEFVSFPSLPSSLPNACIANAPMTGYILAETMYETAIKQGMSSVEAFNALDSKVTRQALGLNCNESLQYALYMNELETKVIKPIQKLEALLKVDAEKYPQCEGV
jgi:hypothetical protein